MMSKVELFENDRASGYNKFVDVWIPGYRYFISLLPKLLDDKLTSDLLVVGCGTGNEIEELVKASNHWTITGIDPSPEMMQQAKEKLQGYKNVTLITGVLSDLDQERKFNAATLLLVLHFLEDNGDKLQLLKDISQRLLPGAKFIILDITGDKMEIQHNLNILKLLLPDGLDEIQKDNRLNRIENELYATSEQRLSELLQEAGFDAPIRFFQSSIYLGWITRKRL